MDWKNGIKGGPFSQKQIHQFFEFLSGLTPGQIQWLSGYFSGIGTLTYEIPGEEVNTHEKKEKLGKSLYILYGTQTGNSENLAREMEKKAREAGLDVTVKNMAVFKPREFRKISNLAVIVSTQGMGEPPIQVEELHKLLHSKKAPDLSGIKFSVLALGDSGYAQFCQTGKEFDNILKKLGGERICDRVDCDIDYEEDALNWMKLVVDQVN